MALPKFILTELQSLRVVNNFALNGILAQTLEPERKYQNSRLCIFRRQIVILIYEIKATN